MAAYSKAVAVKAGKRLADQIWPAVARSLAAPSASLSRWRRGAHSSVYDREVEEQVRPALVPDYVVPPGSDANKYWGPHPRTGVFGPAAEQGVAGEVTGGPAPLSTEQTVWFRPLEDIEKPPPTH